MAWPDLADIRLRVRDQLNEDTASFYTDNQIDRWINDGERDIAIKGLCLESIQSLTTVASTRTVTVSCIKPLHVEYKPGSGTRLGLIKINPLQLGRLDISVSTPQYWFQWGNKIGIEPKPGTTTYNLDVYTAIGPTVLLSGTTDEPQIPAEFQHLIVDYAVYRGLIRARKFSGASIIYSDYIKTLQEIRMGVITKYNNIQDDLKIPDIVVIGGES